MSGSRTLTFQGAPITSAQNDTQNGTRLTFTAATKVDEDPIRNDHIRDDFKKVCKNWGAAIMKDYPGAAAHCYTEGNQIVVTVSGKPEYREQILSQVSGLYDALEQYAGETTAAAEAGH